MNRREVILNLLKDGSDESGGWSAVPAAFFLHFGGEFRQGPSAIEKHREFFRYTGMDFVKIQYELAFPLLDIESPSDWARVPALGEDFFAPQLEVVDGLVRSMKSEAPVIVTLYSPFMCAGQMAGSDRLDDHLREDPDAVSKGLEIVTENMIRFAEGCRRRGVDGFYCSTQGGESRRFADPAVFRQTIKPFDLRLMREAQSGCPFNILHLCDYHRDRVGGYDDLSPFLDYPGQVVNCHPVIGGREVGAEEISRQFGKPFMGGLDRHGVLAHGTEAEIRDAARDAIRRAPGRFLLGADCTVPGDTPWENLRAAIDEAHRFDPSSRSAA